MRWSTIILEQTFKTKWFHGLHVCSSFPIQLSLPHEKGHSVAAMICGSESSLNPLTSRKCVALVRNRVEWEAYSPHYWQKVCNCCEARDEILEFYFPLSNCANGPVFGFMDDNADPHNSSG
ncbi:hypothetical protein AVEN_258756-1 [Araneus ventricosus]|uniref:Uncharacterized protein n=1 Tax=Araneus ventricosus TaxID=182803 RepID=A0A4Y2D0F9_ARAVE|nr:hypothetical protein AVEN_258756-1 [Araneus ventricosus]